MINGPTDQRTPPMTPQLALRVAFIGGCALVMFALIFFRLWFLQVLDTAKLPKIGEVPDRLATAAEARAPWPSWKKQAPEEPRS